MRFCDKRNVAEGDALNNRRRRWDFERTNDKRPVLVILTKLTNQHQFEILPKYGNIKIYFELDNMSGH